MSEFIVNAYEFRVTPIGERISKAIPFKHTSLNSIDVMHGMLLAIQNKVENVYIFQKKKWISTRQSLFLHKPKSDTSKGIFSGIVEVGSAGSFHLLRKQSGAEGPELEDDDLSMRYFYYRLEMPPDSSLGFMVTQRHGRNTAANAMQQSVRRAFQKKDHTAHFRLVTDENAFDEYLTGRVSAVKAQYVPQRQEARQTLKRSIVLGNKLSRDKREDMEIELKVKRPITVALRKEIKAWLTSPEASRPQIVTLPVDDDPDKLILAIETDSGKQKQLHPDMIADMALSIDLSDKVGMTGKTCDVQAADTALTTWCVEHRAKLTT